MFFGYVRRMVRDAATAGLGDFLAECEDGGTDVREAAELARRRLSAPAQVPALPAGGGDDAEESAGPAKAKRGR